MTRINCVPPSELTKKHLNAEFFELPRIFTEVRRLIRIGIDPAKVAAPAEYTLGKGHLKFFYTRLGWLRDRHSELVMEMLARGMKVNALAVRGIAAGLPEHLMGDWTPDEKAMAANRARIAERLLEAEQRKREKLEARLYSGKDLSSD